MALLCNLVRTQRPASHALANVSGRAHAFSTANRVTVSVESSGIAHVQLNRPEKLNALDMEMFESIAEAGSNLKQDRSIRAVILSGKGRAFSTGLDVQSMAKNSPNQAIERLLERPEGRVCNLAQEVSYCWRELPFPVIAVLQGMCYGGGMQIALGADFRFATPDCKLSIMESKWGLIPDMSISVTLKELVSIDVAKELTMTGRIIDGVEASKVGLVTRCAEDPMEEALKLATDISKRSPDAVSLAKELYQKTWMNDDDEYALKLETELQRKLLKSWNQLAASGRNFGVSVPYFNRKGTPSNTDNVAA